MASDQAPSQTVYGILLLAFVTVLTEVAGKFVFYVLFEARKKRLEHLKHCLELAATVGLQEDVEHIKAAIARDVQRTASLYAGAAYDFGYELYGRMMLAAAAVVIVILISFGKVIGISCIVLFAISLLKLDEWKVRKRLTSLNGFWTRFAHLVSNVVIAFGVLTFFRVNWPKQIQSLLNSVDHTLTWLRALPFPH